MTYIVTKACLGCKNRACVDVCPVDCFYDIGDPQLNDKYGIPATGESGPGMLMINPDECIDCGACVAECPTAAIYSAAKLPEEHKDFKQLNADRIISMTDDEREAARCVPDEDLILK